MSEQTQWRPDRKDIDDLTVVILKAQPSNPWHEGALAAEAALLHLQRQGRLLPLAPPKSDKPELPLDHADTIAGHVDLSALSIPPKDRDAEWFEQTGLK